MSTYISEYEKSEDNLSGKVGIFTILWSFVPPVFIWKGFLMILLEVQTSIFIVGPLVQNQIC